MQCQAAAHCPKKINPVGSLAVREAGLAAIVQQRDHLTLISSPSLSDDSNSVSTHYFVIDCLTPRSPSLSRGHLAQTKRPKVCACVDLCVFKYTALTENILEEERKRGGPSQDAVTESPPRPGEESAISAGFSRCEVGWGSGSRTRIAHEVGNTSRFSWNFFSVAGKTNSGPSSPSSHTPFMCLDEGEGCNEWQGCESSLYSAQQTFFLLKLCAICSHHALTHTLKHPAPPVLLVLGSGRGRLMNT